MVYPCILPGPGQFTWSRRYHGCWLGYFGCFASKKCEDQQTFYMFVIYERIWLTGWWFQILCFACNYLRWLQVEAYSLAQQGDPFGGRSHSEPTSLWSEGTPFREILENFQYMLKAQITSDHMHSDRIPKTAKTTSRWCHFKGKAAKLVGRDSRYRKVLDQIGDWLLIQVHWWQMCLWYVLVVWNQTFWSSITFHQTPSNSNIWLILSCIRIQFH